MGTNLTHIDMNAVYTPSPKLVTRVIEEEMIIVPIESGVADIDDALYSLNPTGRVIWEMLEQKRTVNDICFFLCDEYNASQEEIKTDLMDLLEELFNLNLIIRD